MKPPKFSTQRCIGGRENLWPRAGKTWDDDSFPAQRAAHVGQEIDDDLEETLGGRNPQQGRARLPFLEEPGPLRHQAVRMRSGASSSLPTTVEYSNMPTGS